MLGSKATHVATLTLNSSPVIAWRQTPNIIFKQLFLQALADTSESMFLCFLSSSSVLDMCYWCVTHPGRHSLTKVIPGCQPSSLPPQLLHLQGIFSSCSLWVCTLTWEIWVGQLDSNSSGVNDNILSEGMTDSSGLKKEKGNKYPTASLRWSLV